MTSIRLSTLVIFAVVTLASVKAEAYNYRRTCRGNPVKLATRPAGFYMHSPSHNTTDRKLAFFDGLWPFSNVVGMKETLIYFGERTSHSFGNSKNEAAIRSPGYMGSAIGLAVTKYSACDIFGPARMLETDIYVVDDISFSDQDRTQAETSASSTYLHEFGHAIGLGHSSERFSIMFPYSPFPMVGGFGRRYVPLPDDAAGGRSLYSSGAISKNLYASAQRITPTGSLANVRMTAEQLVCPGDLFSTYFSFGNNGNWVGLAFGSIVFIRTDEYPMYYTPNALLVGDGPSGELDGSTHYSSPSEYTFTVPATVVPGAVYRIFYEVYHDGMHVEDQTYDNTAMLPGKLKVRTNCP